MDRRGGTWKLLGSVVYAHSKVGKKPQLTSDYINYTDHNFHQLCHLKVLVIVNVVVCVTLGEVNAKIKGFMSWERKGNLKKEPLKFFVGTQNCL